MKTSLDRARRAGGISARDGLVFIVTVLVVVVLVEGIIIANASNPQGTYTMTSTVTYIGGGNGTDTAVTVTVTSTAAASTKTVTITAGSASDNTVTSTVTTTVTSTVTGNSTSSGPLVPVVTIPAGSAASDGASKGYDPDLIVVVLGVNNTVTWINEDNVYHTVTSTSALEPFNSGQIAPGGTFTYNFTTAGNYSYFDENYPWMSGQVTVEA